MSPSIMKLLGVLLLQLLLSSTCLAEVVADFTSSCNQFFPTLNGAVTPPTRFSAVGRYKQICQTLNDKSEYATFYDQDNKIPVYSEYRFYGKAHCTRKTGNWFIEPQLDDPGNQQINMASESAVTNPGLHQAVNGDYKNSGYDRGHLAPKNQANTQNCADATFTLTNAAPQKNSFNGKWYREAENVTATFLTEQCINKGLSAYIVTGVVPGTATINNRVRVPSHFWTAACCLDNNNIFKKSIGFIQYIDNNGDVKQQSVKDLENKLTDLYRAQLDPNTHFLLFGEGSH